MAKKYGADHAIDFKTQNVVQEVQKLTHGRGADCAVEALGMQSTFENCCRSIKPGELVVMIRLIVIIGWH